MTFFLRKQSTVAQSSAEAELGRFAEETSTACSLQRWEEMTSDCSRMRVYSDSSVGRAIACRRGCGRVRHLSVWQLFGQHSTKSRRVSIHTIGPEDNPADLGTKVLPMATVYKQACEYDELRDALQGRRSSRQRHDPHLQRLAFSSGPCRSGGWQPRVGVAGRGGDGFVAHPQRFAG